MKDEELKRRLRSLSGELERSTVRPTSLRAKRPVRLRHSAAGIGLAACIAAGIAIAASVIPKQAAHRSSPNASTSTVSAKAYPCMVRPRPSSPPSNIQIAAGIQDQGKSIPLGSHVTLWIQRTNRGTAVKEAWGYPRTHFIVYDNAGVVVYDSRPDDVLQPLMIDKIEPGHVDNASELWNLTGCSGPQGAKLPLPAGTYTMVGVWAGNFGGASNPVRFSIG